MSVDGRCGLISQIKFWIQVSVDGMVGAQEHEDTNDGAQTEHCHAIIVHSQLHVTGHDSMEMSFGLRIGWLCLLEA